MSFNYATLKFDPSKHPKDAKIMKVVLETIVNNPTDDKYKKIRIDKTKKLLEDSESFFCLLEKFGFVQCKNNCNILKFTSEPLQMQSNIDKTIINLWHLATQAWLRGIADAKLRSLVQFSKI